MLKSISDLLYDYIFDDRLSTRLSIVPGLFQFSSPGTFRVSRSCPGRTTGPSRSLGPVLAGPRDLGPFVPGVPGRDQIILAFFSDLFFVAAYQEKKKERGLVHLQ
jgi:hypothetical protein